MDEILIEEKRYVSSKQAAKLTGYAKDYIGQLCREGRVPARLVGRSWYVLESAIQDHRFGAPAVSPKEESPKEQEISTPLASSYGAPRYEAASHEEIASIEELAPQKTAEEEVSADLQESWHSWFAQTSAPEAAQEAVEALPEPEVATSVMEEEEGQIENLEETEVNVPIRAIHHSFYQPAEEEIMPRVVHTTPQIVIEREEVAWEEPVARRNRLQMGLRVGGVLIGALSVIAAILGSGYFDSYILSNKQVSLMAGVSFYDR